MRPVEIAKFMIEEMRGRPALYKHVVAERIEARFGSEYARRDSQGRWKLATDVLREFEMLAGSQVTWDKHLRAWRYADAE